jgi:hypothetical protein
MSRTISPIIWLAISDCCTIIIRAFPRQVQNRAEEEEEEVLAGDEWKNEKISHAETQHVRKVKYPVLYSSCIVSK